MGPSLPKPWPLLASPAQTTYRTLFNFLTQGRARWSKRGDWRGKRVESRDMKQREERESVREYKSIYKKIEGPPRWIKNNKIFSNTPQSGFIYRTTLLRVGKIFEIWNTHGTMILVFVSQILKIWHLPFAILF